MNAHWVKLVSVAALALAGTLAVACSSDDDDDDNGGTQGSAGTGGKAGSGGGSGTGGGSGAGGGSGSAGASGAGGGGMIVLPPVDKTSLEKALLNEGKGAPKYSPTVAPAKWTCSTTDSQPELTKTDVPFHNGSNGTNNDEADARYCSNYNLAGAQPNADDRWPLGAASMKETLNGEGDIIEWSYYALKDDGTWYGTKIVPVDPNDEDTIVPVEQDKVIDTTQVTLKFTEGGCTDSACHSSANTNAIDWVIFGDDLPKGSDPGWLEPNPYTK